MCPFFSFLPYRIIYCLLFCCCAIFCVERVGMLHSRGMTKGTDKRHPEFHVFAFFALSLSLSLYQHSTFDALKRINCFIIRLNFSLFSSVRLIECLLKMLSTEVVQVTENARVARDTSCVSLLRETNRFCWHNDYEYNNRLGQ